MMPAGVAHGGHEPCAYVVDARASLQEREEDFLDQILRINDVDAELAARHEQQQCAMLDVERLDLIARELRWLDRLRLGRCPPLRLRNSSGRPRSRRWRHGWSP